MNHRSRPDIPPQWRPSPSPHVAQLQEKSQPAHFPVIPDPRSSLSSPPESPLKTPPFLTFAGKGPVRTHPKQPPSDELQEIEDEEYVQRPYNPYNLPPASVIAVEVGSQSQSNNSLSRTSPRANLDGPVVPEDEDSDDAESRAITISTFFSPDLDARLPRTPDSDDNVGRRGRPVVPKRIASRGAGGAVRSVPRTTRASPMTTPTQSRFSRDTRDRDSHETSFACAGAKAVTNNSKRRNLAALLGIKGKGTNKNAPKVDENVMDLEADGGPDDLREFEARAWGDTVSDAESWDEGFFAAGGGREDRGSGEGDGNGQWTDYLQAVGDALTIVSTDFVMPRAAPVPPNPSLPTIPTLTSLSPLALDDPTQNGSVVTSTPRTKERAKKSLKRTGRIISTGFPSPTEMRPVPTTTFGLGLEGIETELALALDTDFMDIDDYRDVNALDADGDVNMDQMTDITPTMTTRTTITNGKMKNKSQAMDMQRQQQPTPAESTVRLPPTSLSLKTPFGGNTRSANFAASASNLPGVPTSAKPFSLPHNKQLLLTRSLAPRTPLSGSKPPAQKLMGKTMISLPSVSTTVVAPRPARWTEPSQATPTQQPLSPSPTPSPETPCPPERLIQTKKPARPVYAAEKALPVPNVAKKGGDRVEKVAPMNKDTQVYGKRAGAMDEVQVCAQIDECIAATDKMEETLRSCSYFDSTPFTTICDLLKGALVEMMGTIAGGAENSLGSDGSGSSVAVTEDVLQWRQKHELLERSIQKNVHKFYQLAEQTCSKPPRISKMEERMDKLVAYLRKFRDLNIRILASYDKLRVLLLSGRLASAVALARANSTSNSKRRHDDMSVSMSMSTNQPPKQRQRPSAAGPVKSSRGGDATSTRRRADSFTATRTTRNQNAPSQATRRNASQMVAMTRSTSLGEESTAEMFTAKSRYTHTSKGVQAQIRDTRENTRDTMISPPLTRSNSRSQTYDDIPTRSHSHAHTVNSKAKGKTSSLQKSKALSPLENFV